MRVNSGTQNSLGEALDPVRLSEEAQAIDIFYMMAVKIPVKDILADYFKTCDNGKMRHACRLIEIAMRRLAVPDEPGKRGVVGMMEQAEAARL